MKRLAIALAQYPIDRLSDEARWRAKTERWVAEGAATGARLLVFPEYGAMELAALDGARAARSLSGSIAAVSARLPMQADWLATLAARFGVTIVAPSGPCRTPEGTYNIADILAPGGRRARVRKAIPTPWERDPWGIDGDPDGPLVFTVEGVRVGVCICYDGEFPLIGRRLAQAGAQLILMPSCTETAHGWQRVRLGARARALENQCFAVHTPLIGDAPWCPPVETNTGAAGVWGPPDTGLADNGLIAEGQRDRPGWVHATLDLTRLETVREGGGVRGFRDWDAQAGATPLPPARFVALD